MRRRQRWGTRSSSSTTSSGVRLSRAETRTAPPGRLRCDLGCALGPRSRSPSSRRHPPLTPLLRPANPQRWRRPERQAPSASARRPSLSREHAASTAAEAAGWPARPRPERKTTEDACGAGEHRRPRQGCVRIFNVLIWMHGAPTGAHLLRTASATRLQRGCDGGSGKLETSESVGETFHLVKFLPGCCRELWSLPLPARSQRGSALRQEPGDGYPSWLSLELGIGERA